MDWEVGGGVRGVVDIVGRVFIIINGCYELVLFKCPGCSAASGSAQ